MKKVYFLLLSLIIGTATAMAANPALYLRGGFNGWGDSTPMTETDGVYTVHLESLSGDFKIANADWTEAYGSSETIELDKEYVLSASAGNISIPDGVAYANVDVTFTYATKTMKITGEPYVAKITYALNGQFTDENWVATPLEEENGKWVATIVPTVPTGCFGIMRQTDGSQSGYYKGAVNLTEENTTVYLTLESEGGYGDPAYTLTVGKEYKFSFVPETGELTITFNGEIVDPSTIESTFNFKEIADARTDWDENGVSYITDEVFTSNGVTFVATASSGVWGPSKPNIYKTSSGAVRVRIYPGCQITLKAPEGYYIESAAFYSDLSPSGSGLSSMASVENFTCETVTTTMPEGTQSGFRWICNEGSMCDEFVMVNSADNTKMFSFRYIDVVARQIPAVKKFGLVGSFPDSNWDIDNVFEMEANGNVFTYGFESLAAGTAFKIATVGEGWSGTYGAEAPLGSEDAVPVNVTVGEEMNAWKGSSNNFVIEKPMENVTITFTYDAAASAPSKVLVEGDVVENPVEIESTFNFMEIAGTRTDWDENGASYITDEVFTSNGITFVATAASDLWGPEKPNIYKTSSGAVRVRIYPRCQITLKAPEGYYIESATFYSDLSLSGSGLLSRASVENFTRKTVTTAMPEGATSGSVWTCNEGTLRNELVMVNSAENTSMFSFRYIDVVAKQSPTGVEGIGEDADINAPVEYYNLNGVRVAEPSNGIFIRRQGGNTSKIIVR